MMYDDFLKAYEALIRQHEDAEQATEDNRALFERTHETLEASLKSLVHSYEDVLKELDADHQRFIESLKALYSKETERIQTDFLEANQTFEKELNESEALKTQVFEETFEADERIDQTYQSVYDTANATQDEKIETIKQDIQAFSDDHTVKQAELKTTTDEEEAKIQAQLKAEKTHFDEAFERLANVSKVTKKEIIDAKNTFKEKGLKPIRKLEESFHAAIKPYNEKTGEIKLKYQKELNAAVETFDKETAKLNGYINEAKKINDTVAIKKYQAELKDLKASHAENVESIESKLSAELDPVELDQESVQKEYHQKLLAEKVSYIQTLLESMARFESAKTDEMLQVDDINLNLNIAEKKHLTQIQLNKMDFLVQSLNYDQYKFEQTLLKEKEKALLGPAFDATVLSAKEALQAGHAEQEKNRQEVTYQLEYSRELFDLKRSHAANEKNTKQRYLEAYFSHDKTLSEYRLKSRKHQTYLKRETMLNQLYLRFSDNYTALSSAWLNPWEDPLMSEQSIAIKRTKEYLSSIKTKALADHERLMSAIETVYVAQITPLKKELKDEERLRDAEIQKQEALTKKQRNTLKLRETESPRKLDKALESLALDHQKSIKKINRDFTSKVSALKTLMEEIESSKVHSTEEAKTLLNHILDQADTRLKETEALFNESMRLFHAGISYMDKSAGLFSWFQDQRLTKTESALESLHTSKEERLHTLRSELLDTFDDKCTKIDAQDSKAYDAYQKKLHAMNEAHQAKLESLYKDHEAYLKQNHGEIAHQLSQVEQNRLNITEEFDQQIRDLDAQVAEKRNKYFAEKTALEETLAKDIAHLKTEYHRVRDEKTHQRDTSIQELHDQLKRLKSKLEKDAIYTLPLKDMRYIEGLLEKSIPMRSIIEES